MLYDPVKNIFASVIKKIPSLRILFYKLLDLMFLRSWYVRRELRSIRKNASGELKVFDAGTGFGQYTYFMSRNLQPVKIHSADVKEDWIKDLKEFFSTNSGISFSVEDLRHINYSGRFDLIICVDVMEHIEEDTAVFKNFFNSLKPGGFLLINSPSVYGGSDVHDDEDESFIGEHARDGYSAEDLKNKLVPLGFKVHKYKYTYGFWGDKAWRLGIKYPMKMLNISKLLMIILPFYYILTFPFTLVMMYADYISDNKVGSGINFIAKK